MRLPVRPPERQNPSRLLSQASAESISRLSSLLEIIHREYLHFDDLKSDSRFNGQDLPLLWELTRLSRVVLERPLHIGNLTMTYVQTAQIEQLLHQLDTSPASSRLDLVEEPISPEIKNKYLTASLLEEAIASSQLEGAVTTRQVAKRMLLEKRKPRNKSEQMILNNYITINFIKEECRAGSKLTPELILRIHQFITKGTLEDSIYEGHFREEDVRLENPADPTQLIYSPPSSDRVPGLVNELCDFANEQVSRGYYFHPLVKAILLHYLMGWIHPFIDGNGRTARALFYWCLLSQKYDYFEYVAISPILKRAPAKYSRAYLLAETDHDDVTYFVKYNLEVVLVAVHVFEKYLAMKKEETLRISKAIKQNPDINLRQADVLMALNKSNRAITIAEMKERYRITYQTARTDLLVLASKGYLISVKRGKKFLFELNRGRYDLELGNLAN